MKNRSKRYLALLLSVLMVFSTFGFTSFALEDAAQDEGDKSVAAQSVSEEPAAVQDKEEPAKEEPAAAAPAAEEPAKADAAKEAPAAELVKEEPAAAAPAEEAQPGQSASEDAEGIRPSRYTAPTLVQDDLTYDGESHDLIVAGSIVSRYSRDYRFRYRVKYNDGDYSEWAAEVPSGIAAGSYTVQYKIQERSGNRWADESNPGTVTLNSKTIGKAEATISVSINGWMVGETANEPQVITNPTGVKYVITYQISDTETSDNPPEAVGSYKVIATVDDDNYEAEEPATADFKISEEHDHNFSKYAVGSSSNECKIMCDNEDCDEHYTITLNVPENQVYSGSNSKTVDYSVKNNAGEEASLPTYMSGNSRYVWLVRASSNPSHKTQNYPEATWKNVGTYTVSAAVAHRRSNTTGNGDFNGLISGTFEVTPKTVTLDWDDTEFTYDGNFQYPEASTEDFVEGDDVEITYDWEDDDEPVNAGEHTVTAVLSGDDAENYVLDSETESTTFEISPRELRLNKVSAYDKTYDGKTLAELNLNTATLANIVSGDDVDIDAENGGTGTFADKNVGDNKLVTIDYEGANIQLIGEDKDNYTINLVDSQHTTRASIKPLTVKVGWYVEEDSEEPAQEDSEFTYVYNGEDQGPVAKVENLQSNDDEEDDDCTIVVKGWQTDVGSYTARTNKLAGADKDNYVLVSNEEQDFESTPLPVEIGWYQYASDEHRYPSRRAIPYDYDGNEHAPVARVYNIVDGDECDVTVVTSPYDPAVNADEYVATATELSNPNYMFDEEEEYERDFVINPKEVRFSWYKTDEDTEATTENPIEYTYNGKDQKPVAKLSPDDIVGSDDVSVAVTYSEEESINVGDYTARVTGLTGEASDNYSISNRRRSRDYTIYPLPVEYEWSNLETTYNGEEQKPTVTLKNIVEGDDVTPALVATSKDEEPFEGPAIDAGKYDFEFTLAGESSENYTLPDEMEVIDLCEDTGKWFVINPAAVTVKANDKSIYYGDDVPALDSTISGKPAAGDAVQGIKLSTDYKKNAKAGAYKINVTVDDTLNPNYKITKVPGTLTVNEKVTTLVAKAKAGSKNAKLSWNKVTGAKKYAVYASLCNVGGKEYKCKKIKTVSGTKYNLKKIKGKTLKKNTCYKFYVAALDANGNQIAKSQVGHVITGNVMEGKTNAKSIKLKSASAVELSVGANSKIKVSQKKAKKGNDLLDGGHAALVRYKSGNKQVATVSSTGVITAVGAGWCQVYVQGVDGVWVTVDVTVK